MVVPVTVEVVRFCTVPLCVDNCASTVSTLRSESTTTGFNSTMQVSVTLEPSGLMGFGLLLINITESGAGTRKVYHFLDIPLKV